MGQFDYYTLAAVVSSLQPGQSQKHGTRTKAIKRGIRNSRVRHFAYANKDTACDTCGQHIANGELVVMVARSLVTCMVCSVAHDEANDTVNEAYRIAYGDNFSRHGHLQFMR